ncbi:TIGR03749 family integrating conjugative element protein, partial [Vibrio parahaemolyticus]|uniref:TIGR03749 family integrating conjugative element protein n=1 Tax=Vibrio parahaemolyticus TaxID=670 RepID=UPI00117296E3
MSIRATLRVASLMITLIASHSAFASTPRAMEWRGVPLNITLTPGQETIVNLGSDVRVARPAHLGTQLSDGMRLLLDVSAKPGVVTPPQIDVVLPSNNDADNHEGG